ncbi:MAG: hypothetical protein KBC73_22890 [Burkholderiaceae bacterium]|nr:hypothetical protein [Burkholderiaceae bacterium]
MNRAPRRQARQGRLALVLIATSSGLAGLSGCAPDPQDQPQELARAEYVDVADCVQDWGSEADCEPEFNERGLDQFRQAASAPATGSSYSGGYRSGSGSLVRWLGPFYSRGGQVYRYDGRVEPLAAQPSRAAALRSQTLSVNQVYATPGGRYASTPAAPQATGAKTARGRGGFGGIGRGVASAGG